MLRNVAVAVHFRTLLTDGDVGNQRQNVASLIGVCISTRCSLYQHSSVCEWNQIEVRTLTSLLSLLADDKRWCAHVNSTIMETF
jgi:hypothetical protein